MDEITATTATTSSPPTGAPCCSLLVSSTTTSTNNSSSSNSDLSSRIAIMNTKFIVKNKNYYVFDSIPTPDTHPLPNCAYIVVDTKLVHQSDLASSILSLRKDGLGEALLPSSVEVIDHLKRGGVELLRRPKDTRRWAVITSYMIKAGSNLVKERDWFYVGEAVRQSVLYPPPPPMPSASTTACITLDDGVTADKVAASQVTATVTVTAAGGKRARSPSC